jgi:hypothetical protein
LSLAGLAADAVHQPSRSYLDGHEWVRLPVASLSG